MSLQPKINCTNIRTNTMPKSCMTGSREYNRPLHLFFINIPLTKDASIFRGGGGSGHIYVYGGVMVIFGGGGGGGSVLCEAMQQAQVNTLGLE